MITNVIRAGWVSMKPNNFQFENYMIECARSLCQEPEHPTDALILPLIQLQNIAEVNHRCLLSLEEPISDHMDGLNLELKVRSFQAELQTLKLSLEPGCEQPGEFS